MTGQILFFPICNHNRSAMSYRPRYVNN